MGYCGRKLTRQNSGLLFVTGNFEASGPSYEDHKIRLKHTNFEWLMLHDMDEVSVYQSQEMSFQQLRRKNYRFTICQSGLCS